MARMIDADVLQELCDRRIKDTWNSNTAPVSWAEAYADFKDDIDSIPTLTLLTVDVVSVQHGKWIWKQGVCEDEYLRICSCCKRECHSYYDDEEGMAIYILSDYCPNCGAKMDEV